MHNKIILFVLLALITSFEPAAAQNTKPSMNKTTGVISRLKAHATLHGGQGLPARFKDSTYYFYSGDNGWDESLRRWKFDSSYYYKVTSSQLEHWTTEAQFISQIHIDSLIRYKSNVVFKLAKSERSSYLYNSGKLSEILYETWNANIQKWEYRNKTLLYYNSAGKLTDSLGFGWSGGTWDSTTFSTYAQGPHGITSMTNRNRSGSRWVEINNTRYNYSNGKLSEILYGNSGHDILNYDNSGNVIERIGEKWDVNTSAWVLRERDTFTYDNRGNMLTEVKQSAINPGDTLRTQFEYNSYNQLVHIKYEKWQNQSWQPILGNTDEYFYYEEVFPSSVEKVNKAFSTINLYPVPATNVLTVDIVQPQASELIFSIYTVDGKILRQWNRPLAGNQYKETVSIVDMPVGNYILKVNSTEGEISRQFQITR